jgi:hypothetical protein
MAPKKQPKNAFQRFLDQLKVGYYSGQNAIARTQTTHGFNVSKNAALNWGKVFGKDYDPRLRIRPKDPMVQQREMIQRIGLSERIYNNYYKPRVKLAD